MPLHFRKVLLTVKSDLDPRDAVLERVLNILDSEGVEVLLDERRIGHFPCAKGRRCTKHLRGADAIVVIGGDGTILRAMRDVEDLDMPIIGVNRGAVGFLAETNADEAETLLPKLLQGKGVLERRALLDIGIWRKQKRIREGIALNEAVIAQGAIARLLDVKTTVNGEPLTTFHADGLIVATPTGSTAYSLAAGGPIVHPRLSSLILTPLNPHSFSQKPLVLPGNSVVEIEVQHHRSARSSTEVSLTFDGQVYERLASGDRVRIRTHERSAIFVRRKEDTFFQTLRDKLKWGDRPEDGA